MQSGAGAAMPGEDLAAIQAAKKELEAAWQWFEWVSEPRLVDEAVYRVRAAELRLMHVMRPSARLAGGATMR